MTKQRRFLALTLGACFFCFGFNANQYVWQSQSLSWPGHIRDMHIHHDALLVATSQGVYIRPSSTQSFTLPKQLLRINAYDIYVNRAVWYAAGEEGVFRSDDQGASWGRIFRTDEETHEIAYHVVDFSNGIAVGTNKGLYYRLEDTSRWHRLSGDLDQENIYDLVSDDQYIYAMTPYRVVRVDQESWQERVIYDIGGQASSETERALRSLTLDPDGALWLLTRQRMMSSVDRGDYWRAVDDGGIPLYESDAMILVYHDDVLWRYVATEKGMYIYDGERWHAAYQGLDQTRISAVVVDEHRDVFIGVKESVYRLKEYAVSIPQQDYQQVADQFIHEPSIVHVQERAVRYAEVHPHKIQMWRRQAQWSAVLPSVGVDVGRNTDELYHWDNASTSIPDSLTKGVDYTDWELSLSWDLGNMIWHDDQIDIDNRSRLMVQLREDVLDQVTRIYFERRRLQIELAMTSEADLHFVMEKKLRIDELTALLDAYTGGWFSSKVTSSM